MKEILSIDLLQAPPPVAQFHEPLLLANYMPKSLNKPRILPFWTSGSQIGSSRYCTGPPTECASQVVAIIGPQARAHGPGRAGLFLQDRSFCTTPPPPPHHLAY